MFKFQTFNGALRIGPCNLRVHASTLFSLLTQATSYMALDAAYGRQIIIYWDLHLSPRATLKLNLTNPTSC